MSETLRLAWSAYSAAERRVIAEQLYSYGQRDDDDTPPDARNELLRAIAWNQRGISAPTLTQIDLLQRANLKS